MPDLRRACRLARPADLTFLLHLQRVWSTSIGFLPKQAFERYIAANRIITVTENETPAGFLSFGRRPDGLLRIYQVAIEPELLRTTLGTKVMNQLKRLAAQSACSVIRLTSRSDIPANLFWPTLGFGCTAVIARETTRGLHRLEWTLQLGDVRQIATELAGGQRPLAPAKKRKHNAPHPEPAQHA